MKPELQRQCNKLFVPGKTINEKIIQTILRRKTSGKCLDSQNTVKNTERFGPYTHSARKWYPLGKHGNRSQQWNPMQTGSVCAHWKKTPATTLQLLISKLCKKSVWWKLLPTHVKKKKLHDMVQEWWTSRHVFLTNGGLLCSDQHQKRLIPHNQTNFRWNMTWDPLHQLNHQLFGNCHWNEADGRNEGYQKTKVICSWDV